MFDKLNAVKLRGSSAIDFALGPRRILAFVEDDIISQCIHVPTVIFNCKRPDNVLLYLKSASPFSRTKLHLSALALSMSQKATWTVARQ